MTEARRIAINKITGVILNNSSINFPFTYNQLEKIVKDFGGSIKKGKLEKFTYGMIEVNGEHNFTITYREDEPEEEKLYTIAHELGHYFLHITDDNGHPKEKYIDSPLFRRGVSSEEDEANEFASSLLMPVDVFNNFIDTNKVNNKIDINTVAKHFNVSTTVALNRGKSLGRFL